MNTNTASKDRISTVILHTIVQSLDMNDLVKFRPLTTYTSPVGTYSPLAIWTSL